MPEPTEQELFEAAPDLIYLVVTFDQDGEQDAACGRLFVTEKRATQVARQAAEHSRGHVAYVVAAHIIALHQHDLHDQPHHSRDW